MTCLRFLIFLLALLLLPCAFRPSACEAGGRRGLSSNGDDDSDDGVYVDASGQDNDGHHHHHHHHNGDGGHGHGPPPPSAAAVHVRFPGGYVSVPGADVTPSNPLTVRVPGASPVHIRVPVTQKSEPEKHKGGGHW